MSKGQRTGTRKCFNLPNVNIATSNLQGVKIMTLVLLFNCCQGEPKKTWKIDTFVVIPCKGKTIAIKGFLLYL